MLLSAGLYGLLSSSNSFHMRMAGELLPVLICQGLQGSRDPLIQSKASGLQDLGHCDSRGDGDAQSAQLHLSMLLQKAFSQVDVADGLSGA